MLNTTLVSHLPSQYFTSLSTFNCFLHQTITNYLPPNIDLTNHSNYYIKFLSDYQITDATESVVYQSKQLSIKQTQLIRAIHSIFLAWDNPIVDLSLYDSDYPPLLPFTSLLNGLKQKEEKSVIETIPLDLIKYIFFTCNFNKWQEVGHLALSCKCFYLMTKDPLVLRKIFESNSALFESIPTDKLSRKLLSVTQFQPIRLGQIQHCVTDKDLKIIAKQGSELKHLSFQKNLFTLNGLAYLLTRCPKLHSIEFHDCCTSDFDGYMTLIGLYAPTLKSLKIVNCNLSDQGLFALNASSLQLSTFEYVNNQTNKGILTDYALLPFLINLKQLINLMIVGCPKITLVPLLTYLQSTSSSGGKLADSIKKIIFEDCHFACHFQF